MAIEIKAPTFPESVADGTVATWHKKPGDAVRRIGHGKRATGADAVGHALLHVDDQNRPHGAPM